MANRGTRFRTETIGATGQVSTGPGNFFFLTAASAPVTIRFNVAGSSFGAENVGAGYVKGEVDPWQSITILGAPGVIVSFLEGDENVRESYTDFRQQIISGSVTVATAPASTVSSLPQITVANGAQVLLFAANPLRKRITVTTYNGNADATYARTIGGANDIKELQPGSSYTFEGTYGLDIRNGSGAVAYYFLTEET